MWYAQLTLTLQITQYSTDCRLAPVTVNNSPIQDYVHPHDNTQPTYEGLLGSNPPKKGSFNKIESIKRTQCFALEKEKKRPNIFGSVTKS